MRAEAPFRARDRLCQRRLISCPSPARQTCGAGHGDSGPPALSLGQAAEIATVLMSRLGGAGPCGGEFDRATAGADREFQVRLEARVHLILMLFISPFAGSGSSRPEQHRRSPDPHCGAATRACPDPRRGNAGRSHHG
jgi:hypothetical protein